MEREERTLAVKQKIMQQVQVQNAKAESELLASKEATVLKTRTIIL